MNKKNYIIISIAFILLLCLGIFSSVFQKKDYSNNTVDNNLAKIEIYSTQNNELIKTIDNKKILNEYTKKLSFLYINFDIICKIAIIIALADELLKFIIVAYIIIISSSRIFFIL